MSAPDELPVKVYSPESSATHPAQLLGELLRDVLTGFPADHLAPFLLMNALVLVLLLVVGVVFRLAMPMLIERMGS